MNGMEWSGMAYSIARHLAGLPEDEGFVLYKMERPGEDDPMGDDGKRYVQFMAYGPGMVRCEVVSNNYLPDELRLSIDDLVRLSEAGWNLPDGTADDDYDSGSPNLFIDVDASDTQLAGDATVFVFRDIWGVVDLDEITTDKEMLRGPQGFELIAPPNGSPSTAPSDRI